jgi:transcriptional regulator with XRE-family HTH domain
MSERRLRGLSQRGMADLLDVSHMTISNWESKGKEPATGVFLRICHVLNREPKDFYHG